MTARLWALLIMASVLILSAAVFVYVGVMRQDAETIAATQRIHPLQVFNLRVRADFTNAQVALYSYLASADARFRGFYAASRQDTNVALAGAQNAAHGASLSNVLRQEGAAARWFRLCDRMLGFPAGAPTPSGLTRTCYASALTFYSTNTDLQERLLLESHTAVRQGASTVRSAAIWGGVASLFAVLLGLLAGVSATRGITRPLRTLAATVRDLAGGDHAARAPLTGDAEVQEVARSVNTLADEGDRQRQQEEEGMRLRDAATEAGIRIRAHLGLPEMIQETVAAIERFVPEDRAYIHLIRDGRMGLPEGHADD
jgi:HAMP domain-containing protein